MMETLRNKVTESGIVTLDLEPFYPKEKVVLIDIKDFLFMEMILKEKDFREALKQTNWQQFQGAIVGIICTADAIIPLWAYMLIVSYLQPVASYVGVGDKSALLQQKFIFNLQQIHLEPYQGARIVIKGCGDVKVEAYAYAEITRILLPVAKSIMYGEPCSTVPVFKQK